MARLKIYKSSQSILVWEPVGSHTNLYIAGLLLLATCVGCGAPYRLRPFVARPLPDRVSPFIESPATVPGEVVRESTEYQNVTQEVGTTSTMHFGNEVIVRAEEITAIEGDDSRRSHSPHLIHSSASELSLTDAIRIALQGSSVIRIKDGFLSSGNPLFSRPEAVPSFFDPAIADSEVLVGQRGMRAALSDFDPQVNTRLVWGGDERIQNSRLLSGGVTPGDTLNEGSATFQSELARSLVSGGRAALVHDWNYDRSNRTGLLFPSAYDGALRAQIRQPLMAGAGREYTSIVGNTSNVSLNITGTPQGVLIAAVNQNVSLIDLEQNIARLVRDIESQYWNLCLAQRTVEIAHSKIREYDGALEIIQAREQVGAKGGGIAGLVQIQDIALQGRIDLINALSSLRKAEIGMSRLLGARDGEFPQIRSTDHPYRANIIVDAESSVSMAVSIRPEVRRQQEAIRGLKLQLRAAELLLKPRLDVVGEYRLNGFGDKLLGEGNPFSSSYDTLLSGQQTGWNAGFEYSRAAGNRLPQERVRNAKLKLVKAQVLLREQEIEIENELRVVIDELQRAFQEREMQAERVLASQHRREALLAKFRVTDSTEELFELVQASRIVQQSEVAYVASQIAYTEAVSELLYREGRILTERGIHIQ